ncbi:uncharacterized protein [Rutidosis leptorrhynchoides]|uniref:uncharacterized protein n=1 Tax=Rutidosis leptorrhynchoides TaxID=125765 RepID=UPI003A9A06CA
MILTKFSESLIQLTQQLFAENVGYFDTIDQLLFVQSGVLLDNSLMILVIVSRWAQLFARVLRQIVSFVPCSGCFKYIGSLR